MNVRIIKITSSDYRRVNGDKSHYQRSNGDRAIITYVLTCLHHCTACSTDDRWYQQGTKQLLQNLLNAQVTVTSKAIASINQGGKREKKRVNFKVHEPTSTTQNNVSQRMCAKKLSVNIVAAVHSCHVTLLREITFEGIYTVMMIKAKGE